LAIAVVGLAVSSCSKSKTTPGGSNAVTIRILGQLGNSSFSPNPASAAGRAVVFKNETTDVHRIRLNDLSIDTGDIAPGATSREVTMPSGGANYHCSNHAGMGGQVFASGDAPPPDCTGIYCY
jgi:plastocyanin